MTIRPNELGGGSMTIRPNELGGGSMTIRPNDQAGGRMNIRVNGEHRAVEREVTLRQLLELGETGLHRAVAVNRCCIPHSEQEGFVLHEDDEVEILVPSPGG